MPLGLYELMKADDPQLISIIQNGKSLEVLISEDGSKATINGKSVTFSDLISRSDYYPISRFVFAAQDVFHADKEMSIIKSCFNAYTWTQLSSMKITELASILYNSWPIHVILYPETKNFWDAYWIINVPTKDLLTTNLVPTYSIKPQYEPHKQFTINRYSPRPVVSGPNIIASGAIVDLDFEYRNWNNQFVECDFDTYIKYNAGYLPKNIVKVKNGKATVKVMAMGLDAGDTITLKFSIGKVYTNAVQHTLTVI